MISVRRSFLASSISRAKMSRKWRISPKTGRGKRRRMMPYPAALRQFFRHDPRDRPLHSSKYGWEKFVGSGFWVLDSGLWALGSGFWVLGSGLWALGSGLWGFWVQKKTNNPTAEKQIPITPCKAADSPTPGESPRSAAPLSDNPRTPRPANRGDGNALRRRKAGF